MHISRRHMLAITGAASIGGRASADTRIEKFDRALDNIVSSSEPVRELAVGMGGPAGPVEGPVWWKEGGYLLFSDIQASKRMKYTPGQGVTLFQDKTNQANGLTRDLQGRLIACEHETRRVVRLELDGSLAVIANSFQNQQLNRPNDVIVKSDGAIYFTDPMGFTPAHDQWELSYAGVYRVSADRGTITLLANDFVFPNGLAFSPDESVLYIGDYSRGHVRAFDMAPNGTPAKQTDRIFADLRGPEPGGPDGMKVDTTGNVYCAMGNASRNGLAGIYILDPKGKKLGRIVHGYPETTNIAFGGSDWKTLYFTTRNTLGSVNLKIAGLPVPAKKL